MAVLSVIPGVGAALVWVPVVAYLAIVGEFGGAAALGAWVQKQHHLLGSGFCHETRLSVEGLGNVVALILRTGCTAGEDSGDGARWGSGWVVHA